MSALLSFEVARNWIRGYEIRFNNQLLLEVDNPFLSAKLTFRDATNAQIKAEVIDTSCCMMGISFHIRTTAHEYDMVKGGCFSREYIVSSVSNETVYHLKPTSFVGRDVTILRNDQVRVGSITYQPFSATGNVTIQHDEDSLAILCAAVALDNVRLNHENNTIVSNTIASSG